MNLTLGEYKLKTLFIPSVKTNCYLLSKNGEAILVDAAGDGKYILDYVDKNHIKINAILITHGHYDHIEALDLLIEKFQDAKVYAASNERQIIEDMNANLMDHELKTKTKNYIKYIEDGNCIHSLGLDIKIIITPGHTIGSSCYYIDSLKILFSGDTLFRDTYGRYDLPTGNAKLIKESILTKLFTLDSDIRVFSGHGFNTTIGYEIKNNEINFL